MVLQRGEKASSEIAHAAFSTITGSDPTRPFVVAQLGQSIDGRVATPTGESKYINGERALDHLHRLRSVVDAVVVGVGTVIADNPRLTVRRAEGQNPTRVVIDPNGRMPTDAALLADDGADVIVIRARAARLPKRARQVVLRARDGRMDPAEIVSTLFHMGCRRLLIEGGARTVSTFIDAGSIDRLHVLLAPIILGSGSFGLQLAPIASLDEAIRPSVTIYPLDEGDMIFDCDLRAAGAERAES